MERKTRSIGRRGFMKTTAAAVAGSAMLVSSGAKAAPDETLDHRNERPIGWPIGN